MNKERFKAAIWANDLEKEKVMIGGAGSIGSWLSLFLTRAGFKINIFDKDSIEELNLAGQFYKYDNINEFKVYALQNNIYEYTKTNIQINLSKIDENLILDSYSIYFSAFDNIEARRILFKEFLEYGKENSLFIDGRLEAEMSIIYSIPKTDKERIKKYKENALSDNIQDAVCSYKYTTHMAAYIASKMTIFAINHVTNKVEKRKVRALPFKEHFFSPLNKILEE